MALFHSDVIGSLLRPGYLQEARAAHERGEIDAAAFKRIEDRAVNEAIALQCDAGLEVITDGEMRRYAFYGHLIDCVEGFDKFGGWAIPFRDDQGDKVLLRRPVVVGRLKRRRHLCAEEFAYLRGRTDHATKVTLVSAQQAAAYYDPEKSRDAYATIDDYLAGVVTILREEVDELARLGCTYIQVDAPQYAGLIDPEIREGYRRRGNDPDHLLKRCIDLDNAVMRGHAGITFGLHLCRGNHRSRYYASGGYDPVLDVFRRTRFQRFLLEYDDERSGGFEPLRHVPEDRVVVLGLVSSKKGALESKDVLKRRIDMASRHVPLDRLALSTQCGFASTEEGNAVTPQEQAAKLRLVAETAKEIWGNRSRSEGDKSIAR
jgi:5-methyltetrahydropteroyltriglutamate--homocysteine methyltransferase